MLTGVYSNGTLTPFPAAFTGSAINAQGTVAGTLATGDVALYCGEVGTDLAPSPGQYVSVVAINTSGEIAGFSLVTGANYRFFLTGGGHDEY